MPILNYEYLKVQSINLVLKILFRIFNHVIAMLLREGNILL